MRTILMFAAAALLVAGIAPSYLERAGVGSQPAASRAGKPAANVAAASQPARSSALAGPRSVVIPRDSRGHFAVDGTVDGRRIQFMVDTGASAVALRASDAARLGIHPAQRDYTGRSQPPTALPASPQSSSI